MTTTIYVCPCGDWTLEAPSSFSTYEIESTLAEHLEDCPPLQRLLREAVLVSNYQPRIITSRRREDTQANEIQGLTPKPLAEHVPGAWNFVEPQLGRCRCGSNLFGGRGGCSECR